MSAGTQNPRVFPLDGISLADVEAVRLILRGQSVVDWHRLNLRSREEVEGFLRVNGFEPACEKDRRRLRHLVDAAVAYLESSFRYHFTPEVRSPDDVGDLLRMASSNSQVQTQACMILKVAHIINHVDARELRFHLPVPEEVLFRHAEEKVAAEVTALREAGAEVTTFVSSRKSRGSLITKLLSKKSTLASQVFDRMRFRVVVREAGDLMPLLVGLKNRLVPFNYIVPGQSRNEILRPEDLVASVTDLRPLASQLQYQFELEDAEGGEDWNRFSAAEYRMINFVVDLPIRLDAIHASMGGPVLEGLGEIVFITLEFQVFDQATFDANELGAGNHERYKDRQKWDVIRRLMYGGQVGGAGGPGFGGRTR